MTSENALKYWIATTIAIRKHSLSREEFLGLICIYALGAKFESKAYGGRLALPVSDFHKFVLATGLIKTTGGVSIILRRLIDRGLLGATSISSEEKRRLFPSAQGWNRVAILLRAGEKLLGKVASDLQGSEI